MKTFEVFGIFISKIFLELEQIRIENWHSKVIVQVTKLFALMSFIGISWLRVCPPADLSTAASHVAVMERMRTSVIVRETPGTVLRRARRTFCVPRHGPFPGERVEDGSSG